MQSAVVVVMMIVAAAAITMDVPMIVVVGMPVVVPRLGVAVLAAGGGSPGCGLVCHAVLVERPMSPFLGARALAG